MAPVRPTLLFFFLSGSEAAARAHFRVGLTGFVVIHSSFWRLPPFPLFLLLHPSPKRRPRCLPLFMITLAAGHLFSHQAGKRLLHASRHCLAPCFPCSRCGRYQHTATEARQGPFTQKFAVSTRLRGSLLPLPVNVILDSGERIARKVALFKNEAGWFFSFCGGG